VSITRVAALAKKTKSSGSGGRCSPVAKYNRLLLVQDGSGKNAAYAGQSGLSTAAV